MYESDPKLPRYDDNTLHVLGNEFGTVTFAAFPALQDFIAEDLLVKPEWYVSGLTRIIFVPTFLDCRSARRDAFAIYTFLVRLYNYSDERLAQVEAKLQEKQMSLPQLHREFYRLFDSGFCKAYSKNAVPNVHTFSHLWQSRKKSGPLWSTSSEPFEATYAVLRRCFRTGTPNTAKQILTNFYLREMYVQFNHVITTIRTHFVEFSLHRYGHHCQADKRLVLFPDRKADAKVSDAWVTTKEGQIFYIVRANDSSTLDEGHDSTQQRGKGSGKTCQTFDAHPVRTKAYTSDNYDLPWNSVGIWR